MGVGAGCGAAQGSLAGAVHAHQDHILAAMGAYVLRARDVTVERGGLSQHFP